MDDRKYPVVRARLYGPGRRYVQRYDGFGHRDVAADLWREGRVSCDCIDPSALGIGAGMGTSGPVPTAMAVEDERMNVVVCRPFLDTTQVIGSEHFDFYGGQWLPLEGLGIGDEVRHYQYDGRGDGETGAVSRFTLPRNPVFCVSLYRSGPVPDRDWASAPPSTRIELGVGSSNEWSLVLPYGGPPYAMQRIGGVWERLPNGGATGQLRELEGHGRDGRLLLWVAVWRGKLVFSTDGFASDLWVCPSGPETVQVGQGRLALWHNAGQWAFSVIPVKMTAATLDSQPIEADYDTEACAGATLLDGRRAPVCNDAGAVLADVTVTDTTAARTDLGDTQRAWQAIVEPYVHQETGPDFTTCVSPELHAVQIGQYAEIVDAGAQTWEEISGNVERVSGETSNDGRAAVYELSLDNSLGQHADLGEYRRCRLELGWLLEDDTTEYEPAIDGYLVEPEPAVLAGPEDQMAAAVIDPMVRLRDEKCDGRAPVFDGWLVKDVFEWVLDRCGVPEATRDLEDTGTRLSTGAFDRPLWLVEPGRSWGEFLQEVGQFDYGAAVFFDADGTFHKACRYCRQPRTSTDVAQHDGSGSGACVSVVRWELYTRVALAGESDGRGAVMSIQRPRKSLYQSEFANYVAVCGLSGDGTPVRSVVFEPASLFDVQSDVFVGWRKMEVAALETYTTQAETNRLAEELFRSRSQRPEHVSVVIPLEPGMQIGDVIRVNGGERVGASGHKYRVENVRHSVLRGPERLSTTQVLARWLKEE